MDEEFYIAESLKADKEGILYFIKMEQDLTTRKAFDLFP